jgi:hypothetical protein
MKRDVLCIEPGHGSVWLSNAEDIEIDGEPFVRGYAWDSSGAGSSLMPDDYLGEYEMMTFPRNFILRDGAQPDSTGARE